MEFVLDSLQTLTLPTRTSTLIEPTLLVVNTYTVLDSRCNVRKRRFVVLTDGHFLVRALLNVSINGNGSVLHFGDIIKILDYHMVVAIDTCILMIHDFYVQHSKADQPTGLPNWFSIDIDNIKDSTLVDSKDKVWFTLPITNPIYPTVQKEENISIIDNWVVLSNGCIAGTAYRTIADFNAAPLIHSKTDTHGVASYKYLPSIATNIALPFCCVTTLGLHPKSKFDSVNEFSNITTLSGSTYYLANKRDNTEMNRIIKYYQKGTSTQDVNIHTINSSTGFARDMFLQMPQAQVERVFTATYLEKMVHNNQYVCKVKLCFLPENMIPKDDDIVYLYLPLYEYTRSRDLYMYLHEDDEIFTNGPAVLGDYVSILLRGQLESPMGDSMEKESYFISFTTHSGLLQCWYSERDVSTMRSLYIDLNELVTQDECTLVNGVQVSDYNPLSKYRNTPSNIPVVRPAISTIYDPLSEKVNDETDNEDDENSCPLHRGGYKRINYSIIDHPVTKKYRLSPLY